MKPSISLEDRFWAKVDKRGSDECWSWTAARFPQGYGSFHGAGRRHVRAHRFIYELAVGAIPSGMQIDHVCHDPKQCRGGVDCPHRRCVNPAHLKLATSKENTSSSRSNNHESRKTHCPHGHAYQGANIYVCPRGKRSCRACLRAKRHARQALRHAQSTAAAVSAAKPEKGTEQ